MRKGQRQKTTFAVLTDRLAAENAERLFRRARQANRLAHALAGRARRQAYRVKVRALCQLLQCFPEELEFTSVTPDGRIVGIRFRSDGTLHLPVRDLDGNGQRWLLSCRAAVIERRRAARRRARAERPGWTEQVAAAPRWAGWPRRESRKQRIKEGRSS